MAEATTNWIGTREWAESMRGLMFVSYVTNVGPLRIVGTSGDTHARTTVEIYQPRRYLSSTDDPVLARIWDNPDDDIYDSL